MKGGKKASRRLIQTTVTTPSAVPAGLVADLQVLIQQARLAVARSVNASLVLLYWRIGNRIRQDILKEQRAEYG